MKIGIASDHAGFKVKDEIKKNITQYEVIDYGNTEYDEKDDYPIYAIKLAEAVSKKEVDFGIILCNTGIGVSIVCNKVVGVRCALINDIADAIHTRHDNDANIIALNAQKDVNDLINYILSFVTTPFSKLERHQRRIEQISQYEINKK